MWGALCYRSIALGRILAIVTERSQMQVHSPIEFGRLIRARRRELGLSQEAVADVVGVNRRVLGQLEAGKATVHLHIALDVARALGLDIDLQRRG